VSNLLPLIVGALVLLAAGVAVYLTFREQKPVTSSDDYAHALEHWLEGNLDEATAILHKLVHDEPDSLEPFYQLGNLLREQGDAERAAVLHRGLTVRPGLNTWQKFWIGLSLARDLNALERWEASRDVLDSLPVKMAEGRSQYWKTRFRQWHGLGDHDEAARTLRNASRKGPDKDRPWFQACFASYQLDRALTCALAGNKGDANSLLKDVRNIAGTGPRSALVRAVAAAVENDATTAASIASDSLLDSPAELDVFLPLLQEVLLQSGQFSRSLPILERACQAENAPPSLWVDLAMLYEKLGSRDQALRMLDGKAGRGNFTPDAAAPYLKMLVADAPETDFAKVWSMLSMPRGPAGWVCHDCGLEAERVRWFCPSCGGFQTYQPGKAPKESG
jgi:lipopolysaccharide biosynthesis regulator YciM